MDPIQLPEHHRMRAAHESPRCQHIRYNGQRCAAPALRGQDHCHFHHNARNSRIFLNSDLPFIEDATSLQFVLMEVIRILATGHADYKCCALLLYSLQIACANLKNFMAEHPKPELAEGERPQPIIGSGDKEKRIGSKNGDEPSLAELRLGKSENGDPEKEPPRIRSREAYHAAVEKRNGAKAALPGRSAPDIAGEGARLSGVPQKATRDSGFSR